jgi:solute:Na+ symporter, SSS family
MQLPAIDLTVLIFYLLGVVVAGSLFYRKERSTESFMAAGRALPGWLVGMSIFATYVSSISFLAIPGSSYRYDWSRFAFSLAIPVAAWIAVRSFVPLYRSRGEISAYSYLEQRFGPVARSYASIFYLLTQVARMGSVMYLMALPLHALLGWSVASIILLTGISVTVYAVLGGIEAVIWTDAIQGFVLCAGALLTALILLFGIPGGPTRFFALAWEHQKFSLGSFNLADWSTATFWVILANGVFINLQNFGVDQNFIQRYIAARSDRDARRAVWFGGLLYVPVSFVFFLIGTGLFTFYTAQPELLPASLHEPGSADRIFPFFIVNQLPAGLTGLLIAAIFAAAMSTVSTSLNSSATIIYTDFYKRYFRKSAGEKESMRVLYAGSLLWGVIGTSVALAMIGVQSVLDAWWTLSSIFSGGMLGLFLLGMLSRRATSFAAAVGMVTGLFTIVWMSLSPQLRDHSFGFLASPFHSFLTIVIGTMVILFTGMAISTLLSRPTSAGE